MTAYARVLGRLRVAVFGASRPGAVPAASASPSATKVLAETCEWVELPAAGVPTSRTINGHALSANVTLTASDVGADPAGAAAAVSTTSIGAVPTSRTVNGHALSSNVTVTAADVGAPPTSRTVNGYALSADVTLASADVGAAPATRAINTGTGLAGGGNLTGDRTLSIAGYTGPICKDHDEASRTYGANSTTTLKKYDVGASSFLWLHNILVPARNQVGLTCKLVAHMADGSTVDVQVNATDADIGLNAQTCQDRMYGNAGVGQSAGNDANPCQAVSLVVVNGTGGGITANIGPFRLRALAYPRGGGSVTIT